MPEVRSIDVPLRSVPKRKVVTLSKLWFFRLSSLALIAAATPILAVPMRGLAGVLLILGLAVFVGLLESSFNRALSSVRKGISENQLLFFLALWYLVGLVLNIFFRGHGLDDWRLMMSPVYFLIGMCFSYAFSHLDACYRYFQVGFIAVWGIQAAASIRQLGSSTGIAREMFAELQGGWIYGDPAAFALMAMLIPVMVWRSFREAGVLRMLLLAESALIVVTISVSSFATPVGLITLSVPLIVTLAVPLVLTARKGAMTILATVMLAALALFAYRFTADNPLLAPAYERIETVINDPTSGGYAPDVGVTSSRWYLAQISLRSFQEDPLLGKGGGSTRYSEFVGGHSSFLDALGSYGLLGGGGALCGIILLMLAKSARRFWRERNWETLLALTSVVLLAVGGIVNPYWEGWQPALVLIMARPFLKSTRSRETKPLMSGLTAGRKASTSPALIGKQHSSDAAARRPVTWSERV